MSTPFLSVVLQRHPADCGVACLAMLLNVSYESALLAVRKQDQIRLRDVQAAAKRLGSPLRFTRTVDLAEDTGILGVRSPKWDYEHLVILKDGLIVDTDATIWDADVFLSAYDATVLSLLAVREP